MSNKIKQESQITVFDNFADGNIEVLFQDEVHLDVDVSLFYIKSGQEEIQYYVDHVSKPEIEDYTTGKISEISAFVASKEEESEEGIETYVEETIKPAIQNHVDTEIIPELEEYKSQVSALASAASGSAADAVISASEASASASSATSSATTAAENADLSQAWAVKMDGKVEDTDYSSKYYAQQSADKFAEIPAAVDSGLSALSNASNALRTTQITNCITEIPQDIKLELADGVLTLKAGSKIYVPNGIGVFDEITIEDDISKSYTLSGADRKTLLIYKDGALNFLATSSTIEYYFSGETAPDQFIGGYAYWYDTGNNLLKFTSNSGVTWESGYSLPIGELQIGTGFSINQVFNGMGYIGKTLFYLPGLKFLIPNGRNSDGSLNNIEQSLSAVIAQTYDNQSTGLSPFVYEINGAAGVVSSGCYHGDENYFRLSDGTIFLCAVLGYCRLSDGRVLSFSPKQAYRAVDYSDSSWIAAQAMPGEKYINLTLGASNTVYTAPANGYFTLAKMANNGQHIYMSNGRISVQSWVSTTGYIQSFLPVQKGDSLNIGYTAAGDTAFFRFVYAQGEE